MDQTLRFEVTVTRSVEVPHTRLGRWIDGFVDRHGPTTLDGGALVGSDRTQARVESWAALDGVDDLDELVRLAAPPHRLALVLVRRGGYAVARSEGERLVDRKVGRRRVQSRTAAGGWSQQRYARRRDNQAGELVRAVADHAVRILTPHAASGADALVPGGDRSLVAAVLADPRLHVLCRLPSRAFYDLPDPTPSVLEDALRRARSVRITLTE